MAQLHHIIGAILRDIAQARVTSDLYSRDVSRIYEQDSLLRLFPIPRSEIKEITIDLRFAIAEVEIDQNRIEDRMARASGIFERYIDIITKTTFDKLKTSLPENQTWQDLIHDLNTPEFLQRLKSETLSFFETYADALIDETGLDKTKAGDGIKDIRERLIFNREDIASLIPSGVKGSITRSIQSILKSMDEEIEVIAQTTDSYLVDVDVTEKALEGLSESAISSITISMTLRNYVWSQVEDHEGTPIRRLIPE